MLIVRRSKLYYTASGIITPIGGLPVHETASTYFEHYVLIVRRSKLYYTASGIITLIGALPVYGMATNKYYDT